MEIFLQLLRVFVVGGTICMIGQILIITTKMTSSRILVLFLLIGVVLEAFGIFEPIAEFGSYGATVPIVGFGSTLAKGAIEGARNRGIIGAISGGLSATAGGISMAVMAAFIFSLIFSAKTKKC